jgi:NAD(P)H-hydrate epimerase
MDGILLTPAACARLDRAVVAAGTPGPRLMERAGRQVVRAITARFAAMPTVVLCGPGNNGGDGYVVARRLARIGWRVRVARLGDRPPATADAALAAAAWDGPVAAATPDCLQGAGLVVDALFGAGLARPLDGAALALVEAARRVAAPVVAIDIPSGVDGATGAVLGDAFTATLTVTFVRAKPGHLLLPGRLHTGELVVTDIGVDDAAVADVDEGLRRNDPAHWRPALPRRTATSHKYRHGHAVVVGGGAWTTGAGRLAATAALRAGAGLVSILCGTPALPANAARLTSVMTKPLDDDADLERWLADDRLNAWLIGPGAGLGTPTRERVVRLLASGRRLVLDADALTSFRDTPDALLSAIRGDVVLTPHAGEFAALFAVTGHRLDDARAAAARSRAVVILKGADTVIAAPDGRAAIQDTAPAALATAGTGDVLAGIVLGLLAQGMPAFAAAAAAVWIHARAADRLGTGMIAEDLPSAIAAVRAQLEVVSAP